MSQHTEPAAIDDGEAFLQLCDFVFAHIQFLPDRGSFPKALNVLGVEALLDLFQRGLFDVGAHGEIADCEDCQEQRTPDGELPVVTGGSLLCDCAVRVGIQVDGEVGTNRLGFPARPDYFGMYCETERHGKGPRTGGAESLSGTDGEKAKFLRHVPTQLSQLRAAAGYPAMREPLARAPFKTV